MQCVCLFTGKHKGCCLTCKTFQFFDTPDYNAMTLRDFPPGVQILSQLKSCTQLPSKIIVQSTSAPHVFPKKKYTPKFISFTNYIFTLPKNSRHI